MAATKKKSASKTTRSDASVDAFVASQKDARMRADCAALVALMARATGEPGKMWGASIVGFGTRHYVYESGREGDTMLVGFAPRKANIAVYGLGVADDPKALAKL